MNEVGTGNLTVVKQEIEKMMEDAAMRKEFVRKVNALKKRRAKEKKTVSCIEGNKMLVSNWTEKQNEKKVQMAEDKEHRNYIAQVRRMTSLEVKRQKDQKNLGKWDDFRVRRD